MKSLYERVYANRALLEPVRNVLAYSRIIRIDNVAEYVMRETQGLDPGKDFPNLAPPFSNFFMEYRIPQGIGQTGVGVEPESFGFLVVSKEGDPEKDGFRWQLEFFNFIGENNGNSQMLDVSWVMRVGTNGEFLLFPSGAIMRQVPLSKSGKTLPPDSMAGTAGIYAPALLAICFMHCKNVEMVEKAPRAHEPGKRARGGGPRVKYYTLEIEPMKKILRTEGDSEHTGLKRALHICRGHFKDYSKSGLFGKYPGTYWWPEHVRGSVSEGVVLKDYEIKAPEGERAQPEG